MNFLRTVLVADKLENILFIELRRNEVDKHSGTKCFIEGRRAHEALDGSFGDPD